jgi:dihydrofolate reductase/diadenosine tetraphosphate (Ap4A) HIT family hydrolase
MGRKTHESIGRLLPNRQNFVATRQGTVLPGAIAVHDLQAFLETWRDSDQLLWVIGGAELYSYAEAYAQRLEITRLSGNFQADTFFPSMNWSWWERSNLESEPSFSNPQVTGIVFQTWKKVSGWQSPLYNHSAARTDEQRAEMERLEQAIECHFCFRDRADEIILENAHWLVVKNTFPYANTALHLLVVPKKHYLSLSEMPDEFRQSYLEIVATVEGHFELKAYSHFMRVGTMARTGASIAHLHAHIIVGNPDAQDEPVRVKLAT